MRARAGRAAARGLTRAGDARGLPPQRLPTRAEQGLTPDESRTDSGPPVPPRTAARFRSGFLRTSSPALWIIVAVLVVLLVSDLPVVNESGTAAAKATPIPAPTVAPPAHASPATILSGGPNRALCLLGVPHTCPIGGSSPMNPTPAVAPTPAAGTASSWTNITPPYGSPNVYPMEYPASVYYPSGHDVILFGGLGQATPSSSVWFLQNTWSFVDNKWTELISNATCTATTCPAPRAGAMIAYDPTVNSLVLFGGYTELSCGMCLPGFYTYAFNDTWLFSNDTWTNITATAGTAPSARFAGVMTYDPSDNYDLLYGGVTASGNSLGDTWKFSGGVWTNISSSETASPGPRGAAAIATSPDGYVMLFGGEDATDNGVDVTIIQNDCEGTGGEAWWFHDGQWAAMAGYGNDCPPPIPVGTGQSTTPLAPYTCTSVCQDPPCGRIYPALGYSPKNARFVLYGGYGTAIQSPGGCSGADALLNDTYTYALPSGGGFFWFNASDAGDPPARAGMGYASDFTDDYFEVFGGYLASGAVENQTWHFYELVHADLSGPTSYNTGPGLYLFNPPFVVTGYGGTGDLKWSFVAHKVRNQNSLVGNAACLTIGLADSGTFGYNGTFDLKCVPSGIAYNVYRITLTVTDEGNTDHPFKTANWTYTVIPAESLAIYSEYVQDFYANVNFQNTFTIYAVVAGGSAKSLSGSIGGSPIDSFNHSANSKFWNVTLDMSPYQPGTVIKIEAQFGGWTLNTTYTPTMISTPSWLLTLFKATGASQSITPHGPGPWNKTYVIVEAYSWSLSNSTNFSISAPLVGGGYGLIPSVNVLFSAGSQGNLSVTGTFSLSTPSITIGPASLKIGASISMTGTFDVVGSGVQWGSATADISVFASLNASIPIYGFCIFSSLCIGFTLELSISPSITLGMILAPLQAGGTAIIPGIELEIEKWFGSFSLQLSAAIQFSVVVASVGLGIGIGVACAFTLHPFGVTAGWVNGSVFVTVSILWWSDSFNIVSGTIYSWGTANPVLPNRGLFTANGYDGGPRSNWIVQVEYYKAADYDGHVWNSGGTSGAAISDIYPYTEVSGGAAYNGAYFFYTDDNTSLPVTDGLLISAARLNSSSNVFSAVPGPVDPNDYELASPVATTLPNGNLYVVWMALPSSEANVNSPLNLTSIALQGALFYPNNGSWGPVRTFSAGGFAESYQIDATGDAGTVLELTSSTVLPGNTDPEHLVEYNLTTGDVISNLTTSGMSEVVSVRGGTGLALLETMEGNYTLVDLSSGSEVAISYAPPTGYDFVSAAFAVNSPTTMVLLYRGPFASELDLYDTSTGQSIASVALGVDDLEAEAIASGSTYYVFARTGQGIEGWTEAGGTFTNLTPIVKPYVVSYGVVQAASSIVVYALVTTGGNASQPIRSFEMFEIGATLPAVPVPAGVKSGTSTGSGSSPDYLLYAAIAAAAVVLLLAVVFVATRRKPPAGSSPTPSSSSATPVHDEGGSTEAEGGSPSTPPEG
jgi:hypothetical protein